MGYWIDHGADINTKDNDGMTPLMNFVYSPYISKKNERWLEGTTILEKRYHKAKGMHIDFFLNNNAEIHHKYDDGRDVLDLCKEKGWKKAENLLVKMRDESV